ncbi:MAG: hypothetical protein NTY01_14210, partial [Verrucomicrobia bacterium]|nr:hypothetical protein [Verrucomicrobiota bacterium]
PPYRPPEEYDCRVSFTPTGGMINVAAGLSVAGRSFVCLIKTNANNHAMGFEAINDKGVGFNPSGVSMPHLECGRRYTVAVEVRKDGVTAYLDGKRMTGWKTDYRDMSPYPIWKFNDDTLLGIGCVKTTAIFHEMKVIEVTGKGTFTRSAPPTSVAVWQNAINLLPLIDPQKDAVEGGWTVQNGELISNQDNYARIEMPYQPPDEYDFRVEFSSPTVKETGPVQLLSKAGREFRWQCFCRPNNSVGFESVGGANIREGLARAELAIRIQSGQRYVSLVEVRNGVVRGYVNGKLCVEWKTDYADMGIFPKWKLRAAGLLGVGSQIPTTFHRIEVREVTGKGTFTRGAPSGASNTPPLQHSNVPAALSAFCAEVAALPAEQQVARVVAKLKELNPGYSGEEKHGIENDKVVRFHIQYQRSITNIAPVRALAGLRDLNIGYDGIRDVSALRGLRLERLHVNSTQVEDLSPLSGMPLAHLLVGGTKVGDLSPLQGVPLETLFIDHCKVSDLAPLKGRPLTCLGISGNPVRDLSPLRGMALWRLDNDGTAVSDLSPLAGMPMRELRIQKTPATDLSPLAGMPLQKLECEPAVAAQPANARILRSIKTLETINGQPAAEFWKKVEAEQAAREAFIREMAALPAEQQVARVVAKLKELNPGFDGKEGHKIENGIVSSFSFRSTGVTNISPVRALSKLEGLGCAGFTGPVPKGEKSPLEDLSPLRGLPLRWLNCSYSRVADLSPLRGMPLEMLYCHDTQVKDFTPLQGMPLKELVCFGVPISNLTPLSTLHLLEELVCSATPVQDLSPLKGLRLRKLTLGNTPVSDLSPLTGAPLKELYVVRTRVSDLSPLRGAPLEKINYDAIVNSRAENMQVLKSIPTLQTINGQPAAEFWKKAEVGERPKP